MNLTYIEPLLLSTIQVLKKMETQDGPHLQRVNKELRTDLHPYGIKVSEADKTSFKENIKAKFLPGLVSHLENRFPDSEVLTALAVLDPANHASSQFRVLWRERNSSASHIVRHRRQ